MEPRNGRLLLTVAVTLAGMLILGAGTAPALGGDDLPPLPPLPKPADKAVFDLIVEGEGAAVQTVTGSGSNGACNIATNTYSRQAYEYGRGRGLKVVFSKYKFPSGPLILVKRKGQAKKPHALFTVKGSYSAIAEGSATRSGNAVLCNPTTEKVGDEDECGEFKGRRTDLALNATFGGDLVLGASAPSTGIPGLGCGANSVETVSGDPLYGWPHFLKLRPEPVPVSKLFGKKRKFKVNFEAKPRSEDRFFDIGSFEIRSLNDAEHSAVARFIRVRKR